MLPLLVQYLTILLVPFVVADDQQYLHSTNLAPKRVAVIGKIGLSLTKKKKKKKTRWLT